MTTTSEYLAVLSRVMKTSNPSSSCVSKEVYNKLYVHFHEKLNGKLQKSMYPYTSDIIQKTEVMLATMEPLFLFPEIIGKKCMLVSSYVTTNVFYTCKMLFSDKSIVSTIGKIHTQIPFVIIDTDGNESIEVLNYANVRTKLSNSELDFLVRESGKRKIALNKIIQFIIVKTKLKESQLCIFADNIYGDAKKVFWRAISQQLAYVDDKGAKTIDRRRLEQCSVLLMSDEVFTNNESNPIIKKHRRILFQEIGKYVKQEVRPVLYGFWEEFVAIETQILDYYDKQLLQTKDMLQGVVGDLVRLGDHGDETLTAMRSLTAMRKSEEDRKKKLELELEEIKSILKEIESLISEICTQLQDNCAADKTILRYTIDDFFEAFFRCKDFNSNLGKKLLSRLYSYDYDNQNLVFTYVQSIAGITADCEIIEINSHEWEKAKMLIYLLDVDELDVDEILSKYIEALGEKCDTGKEFYAKSLTLSGRKKIEFLQKSLEKGYTIAGSTLLQMYCDGNHSINLLSLANALVPEACMIIADQKMEQCQKTGQNIELTDYRFTYYKIAAANEYLPAIGKIVTMIFEERFSSGFQIPKEGIDDDKYKKMVHDGHIVCQLCYVLIDKMYQVEKYREILGVTLFCLNEKLSEAMSLLSKIDSAIAYYCRGNMYEFGGGVLPDLERAMENYGYSRKKGASGKILERVEKRMVACNNKKIIYGNKKNDDYQPNESYSSTTRKTSTTVDDGCFAPATKILMANKTYCAVENIKVNDWVMVFDHYRGIVSKEKIIANVHDISEKKLFPIITMTFEAGTRLEIVKSHVLFDASDNRYVWINSENIKEYVGHLFASFVNGKIVSTKLVEYSIEWKETNYYMPISKFHLNVFAENILTMPPTKLTVNLFPIGEQMRYDLAMLKKYVITSYDQMAQLVTVEEYEGLPCRYLSAVLQMNNCTMEDFKYAIALYRDQDKYSKRDTFGPCEQ